MNEINPYKSPRADCDPVQQDSPAIGVWRMGSTLIVHRDARLPDICLMTGQPADLRVSRKAAWLSWSEDGYSVDLPVSSTWWKRHVVFSRSSWILSLAALAVLLGGYALEAVLGNRIFDSFIAALPLLFASGVAAMISGRFVQIKQATETHVLIGNVNSEVLLRFPEWPG